MSVCHVELGHRDQARRCTLESLRMKDTEETRRQAALEIYNCGAFLLECAYHHRDQRYDQERFVDYCRRGQSAFELASEVFPSFPEPLKGLVMVCRALGEDQQATAWQERLKQIAAS